MVQQNPKRQGYTLRGPNGKIEYIGISNDPDRRAEEHRRDGKPGKMNVETRPRKPDLAIKWEQHRLQTYRDNHGRKNPPSQ